jgi:hypothetical protein
MARRRDSGSLVTAASSGGKPMMREDVTTGSTDVPVAFHRATSTLFAGFRQTWIEGEDPTTRTTFELSSGAGCGSAYMLLIVTFPDGERVEEYVDVREFLQARVAALISEHAGQLEVQS